MHKNIELKNGVHHILRSAAEKLVADALRQEGYELENAEIRIVDEADSGFDIGIIVALREEFDVLISEFERHPIYAADLPQYFYVFEWPVSGGAGYRCVASFVGGMGPVKAALTTDRLVHRFAPASIVNIGIAGSLDSEVLVGDVVVAEQADDYLYASKATDNAEKGGFEFILGGDPYKTSPSCVQHARNLAFAHPDAYGRWCERTQGRLKTELPTDRHGLISNGILREVAKIQAGNLASSTMVGAAREFREWLRSRDRKYLAIEMEAAGILCATFGLNVPSMIIRGISDFSDPEKEAIDEIGQGALRRYAMHNAVGVLQAFIERQLMPFQKRP